MGTITPGNSSSTPYQPMVISGEKGPFQPAIQPGNYGRNTHFNFMQKQNEALQFADRKDISAAERAKPLADLSVATIRYSPSTTTTQRELIQNAYGYAQQDIFSLESPYKQSGTLDISELTNALGREPAEKQLKAEDLNHDGLIDSKEHATYILFSDNPTNLFAGTLNEFAQNPDAVPGMEPQVLQEWAQKFANGTDSKLDGQITGAEKQVAEKAVDWAPTMVNTTLAEMYKTLNVSNVIDQGNGPAPPSSDSPSTGPSPSGNPFIS